MSNFVVDSSVAVKWFLPEDHTDAASRLLSGNHRLMVPDLLYAEVANVLWKRVGRGEMEEGQASITLQQLDALLLEVHPSWSLNLLALEIACRTGRTAYDSLYIALAVREQAELVTADRRLYNSLQGYGFAALLRWTEDVP